MEPRVTASSPILSREDDDKVATLTIRRSESRNALSLELMRTLHAALAEISQDSGVKVVVLKSEGPTFCSGHDLKELIARRERAALAEIFTTCSQLMVAIARLRQPVIAQVQGAATAAGCQLVATCDLAICADDARFSTPGVNIGLFCSTPMVAVSRAVSRKAAMEMLLLGEMIDATRAYEIGLVNRVVPRAELGQAVTKMAKHIASKSGPVLAIGKDAFGRQIEYGLEDAYDYAARVMTDNMTLDDAREGISAFLEKRQPVWCGE